MEILTGQIECIESQIVDGWITEDEGHELMIGTVAIAELCGDVTRAEANQVRDHIARAFASKTTWAAHQLN